MAEPTLSTLITGKRKRSIPEGVLNAINRGLISTPMLPWELSKKAVSLVPGVPRYEFGTDTEAALRKAQELGVLTDRDLAPATGWQQVLENTAGTAAGGGAFGAMFRAPKMVMAGRELARGVAATSPLLREQARQIGLYDVGVPSAVEPFATALDQGGNEGVGAATRLVGPLAASGLPGLRNYGDLGRTEQAIRRAQARTGSPNALRVPEGAEGLRVPTAEMIPPSGTSIRQRTADAYRRAQELQAAARSPEGARILEENRAANRRTIEGMPFQNVPAEEVGQAARSTLDELGRVVAEAPTAGINAGQIARQVATRTSQIAQDLLARLPGSGAGFERMGNRIYDLMEDVQNWKNRQWRALGDARDDVFVNAQPLRDGESALRAIHGSSAMPEATASPIMRDIRNTFESLYRGAEARNAAAQERIRSERRALLLPTDGEINVSQAIPGEQIRIGDLRQRYRELSDMWERASPSERMLISRLKKSINDSLEQDPAYGQMWEQARQSNVFYKDLTDPSSVYGKAFADINVDRGRQYLVDHVRKVFTGDKAAGQADELADLFSHFSSQGELQSLFRDALGDTIALKARKIGATPEEIPANIRSARGELGAARLFAERIGIPLDEMENMGQQLARDANQAEPRITQLRQLANNPREFIGRAVDGRPEQVANVRNTLQELSAVDPTLVRAIDNGITQAVEARSQQLLHGEDLGALSRDPFNYVSTAVTGRPEQTAQIGRTLEAAMPSPVGPSKAEVVKSDIEKAQTARQAQAQMEQNLRRAGVESNAASGLSDYELANAAALGGAAVGGNPFTFGRAARFAESIANRIAHPLTDTNLYGEFMADPNRYYSALIANPLAMERGAHKLIPQTLGSVERTFSPSRQFDFSERKKEEQTAAPVEVKPSTEDWNIDFEKEPEKPAENKDWDIVDLNSLNK